MSAEDRLRMEGPEWVSVVIPTLNAEGNISSLIRSIHDQDHRPIEVIVVDGGSTDGTLLRLADMARELNSGDFRITVLKEEDFGPMRSPANARNIGVARARSKYIAFFDDDYELIDRSLISKLVRALDEHPCIGVRVIPKADNWLELNCAIDDALAHGLNGANVHRYCGYRREVFEKVKFDPALGFGEDRDFHERIGLRSEIIDAYCARHFAHTLQEWRRQSVWYGRTFVKYLIKHKGKGALVLSYRVGALFSLVLSTALALFTSYWLAALLLFGIFLGRVLYSYARSKARGLGRMAFLVIRETLSSSWFLVGMLVGTIGLSKRALSPAPS